ncbi:MAG: DUF962 domain-containing protein [Ferruginibacter sp.]
MPSIQQWLSAYGESHQNPTNKLIHWICVPAIFLSIIALLFSIKLPFSIDGFQMNVAIPILIMVVLYYFKLSASLAIGMLLFTLACLGICYWVEAQVNIPIWVLALGVFAAAWVGQFYGHHIEGKKPSFLKDIQFLLIGPAWLMSFIYQKLKIAL